MARETAQTARETVRSSDISIGGVVSNNTPEYLHDEIVYNSICQDYEVDAAQCPNEDHDTCWCDTGAETYLLGGWEQVPEHELQGDQVIAWRPVEGDDNEAGYSAICGEIYTRVVWSRWTRRCALCSPCYPGQGDLDTPGEYLTYDLPPEVYGDRLPGGGEGEGAIEVVDVEVVHREGHEVTVDTGETIATVGPGGTPFDVVDFVIEYEDGRLGEEEIVRGFQHLIDSGLAWQFQGHYGRTAAGLIQAGLCSTPGA